MTQLHVRTVMGHGGSGALSQSERERVSPLRLLRPRLRRQLVRVVQQAGELVRPVPYPGRAAQRRRLSVRRRRQQDRPRAPTGLRVSLTTSGVKAKFHYTGPTGPDRTRTDFFARPGPQTRVSDKVRGLCLVGSGRARVVELSYNTALRFRLSSSLTV